EGRGWAAGSGPAVPLERREAPAGPQREWRSRASGLLAAAAGLEGSDAHPRHSDARPIDADALFSASSAD
ncbi:hypothetical protein ACNJEG_21245, partial [Mycobacterium tuberculosis]